MCKLNGCIKKEAKRLKLSPEVMDELHREYHRFRNKPPRDMWELLQWAVGA
jgi:hypothetical protein